MVHLLITYEVKGEKVTFMNDIYYKIGDVSEILGIEQHTLRYLENSLKLKIKRDERGDRLYTDADLEILKLILKLKIEKGLNTTAIKLALENIEAAEKDEPGLPVSAKTPNNINMIEVVAIAKRIEEQNDELLTHNHQLEKRIDELERKIDKNEQERHRRVDELITLWRAEQEKGKSWFSKIRGK